jgi:hypothetical protein
MTDARRDWMPTFADRAVLSDLFKAARRCMTEADDCDPEICAHDVNRMTPMDFAQWVETTINTAARAPVRLDHHENRTAGQKLRRALEIVATG